MVDLSTLIAEGLLRENIAEELTILSERTGKKVRDLLLTRGIISEERLLELTAKELGYEFMDSLYEKDVSGEFLESVPLDYARRYSVIAIKDNGDVKLVTSSEDNLNFLDDIAR